MASREPPERKLSPGGSLAKSRSRSSSLETLGKLLTIVGVLLPVCGAIAREVAYALHGGIPLGIGAALPIPQLALSGALFVVPALFVGLAVGWGLRHIAPLQAPGLPRLSGRSIQAAAAILTIYGFSILFLGYILLALAAEVVEQASRGVGSFLSAIAGVGLAIWASLQARTTEPIPFYRLVPAVGLVAALSATTASFGPTTAGVSVVRVQFEAGTPGVADGLYSVLGEDGANTWLLSCESGSFAQRVKTETILTLTAVPLGPPGPATSWTRIPGVGFVQRCP